MAPLHSLLKRQLKQHFGALVACPKNLEAFLDAVNEAYWQADGDRSMLERSLDLSSQELLTANSEMRAVFQTFPDLYFRLDPAGQILEVNAGSETDLCLPSAQLVGKKIQDIPEQCVGGKFSEAIAQLKRTKALVRMEYSLELAHESKHYEARLLPLLESQILIIVRDITKGKQSEEALRQSEEQLRQSEEKFRQSQKMEAVGRLAGGVAHDFNNLLTVIIGYCELLVAQVKPGDSLRRNAEEIQKAAERAAALTHQLLAFSRKQVLQPKVLDLNDVVAGMEKMTRRLIGEDIELRTVFDKPLGRITADPGQIEQVILNLVVNARDAMPRGGRILVETRNITLNPKGQSKDHELEPGEYVMLAITDSGVGMTDAVKAHLFEPFFTTKGPGKGTGLGLATCYGIIKQSGGDIRVYSEPDHGTTFKIYFPRIDHSAATKTSPVENTPPCRGTETLLLVEDEVSVRRLTASILRNCGYVVHEASDGLEGLQLISSDQSPKFDLIISDIIMPRMGGKELIENIRLRLPEMKVLFISGYTDDALADQGALGPGIAFQEKPFSPRQLAKRVRAVLDEPSALLEIAAS
jgi:two-component system cell cycle sensor histidine kinase/response regulator CckA